MKKLLTAVVLLVLLCAAFAQQPTLVTRDRPYRLQPSDVVEIEYVYTPEYNQVATIAPDGVVTLKLIGPVKVAGLNLEQATAAITSKASKPLNAPELTVTLKDYVKPHFTVYGEVSKPGTYDLHGRVTVLQAIAVSGGVKESSKQNKVLLIRKVDDDLAEVKVISTRSMSSAKGVHEDFALEPDDMLIVPKNVLGKIEPYVRVAAQGLTSLYGVQILK